MGALSTKTFHPLPKGDSFIKGNFPPKGGTPASGSLARSVLTSGSGGAMIGGTFGIIGAIIGASIGVAAAIMAEK